MTRLICFAGVVLTTVLALAADEPNPRPGPNVRPGGAFGRGLTGYPMLAMDQVQKELGLTPEQKEKLKEITRKAFEPLPGEQSIDWAKVRDMKPEELRKIQMEMADRNAKRTAEIKEQVEKILTPKQVEQFKEIEFRQRAVGMLRVPRVREQIELTDDQQQQVRKIQEEMQAKMMQLQRETQEKTLGVLTPEQTKKLKELSGKDLSGWGRPTNRATVEPKPSQKSD